MIPGSEELQTRASVLNFAQARQQAFLSNLLDTVRGQSSAMLSLEDVRKRLNVRGQHHLGHQIVPISHIVGSEGRYADFDRRFLPRSNELKHRWISVDKASSTTMLPPVDLYKIGDIYFVRDGNHRVSVARQRGQTYIDAYVTEFIVDVPLEPGLSLHDMLLKEEYSDFLEWTNLHRLRPDERIEFSEPGGYLTLVRHINVHRYYMSLEQGREISRDEAVADWYDSVYTPVVRAIREQKALEHFPGRTEAELYCWIMDHRWYMRERLGADPGPEEAAREYVKLFGQKGVVELVESHIRNLLERLTKH